MTEFKRRRLNLRRQLEGWMKARLWAQVLIALALGVAIGGALGPDTDWVGRETAELVGRWLALPGSLFLNMIQMVLMPLVAASIVLGLAGGASDPARLRAVGARLAAFIAATTVFAASAGAALALTFRPGRALDHIGLVPTPRLRPDPDIAPTDPLAQTAADAPDLIANLVPQNPLAAATQNEMLAVVIFSLFIGVAFVASANKSRLEPLLRLFEAMLEVSMTVVKWAMYLTPWAVFGLTAQLIARLGFGPLAALGAYVLVVFSGLALLLLAYLLIVALAGRMNPLAFLKAAFPVQLLAFSTSSSAAVMPLTIKVATARLETPEETARFVVPLAATVNMAGTALYQAVAVIFMAQIAGIALSPVEIGLIVMTLVAASIGAPGAPGVSVAILTSLIASFGIPPDGLVFVLGVDRLLDMARTSVNVTGDLAACRLLRRVEAPIAKDGEAS